MCSLYNKSERPVEPNRCEGCPVYKKTGQDLCNGTPYEWAADDWELIVTGQSEMPGRSIWEEYNFLASLYREECL